MSLFSSSQLSLTKSNDRLTVIFEDKEGLNIPQPLKTECEENISRIRANTFSGSNESQIKITRSSTVDSEPSIKRSRKTFSLRSSQEIPSTQEIAVGNFGSEKLLRHTRTISDPTHLDSPSPLFEQRGRRGVRSKPSDVKSQSLPSKETEQKFIDLQSRSLSLSPSVLLKNSPRKLNASDRGYSPRIMSVEVEKPIITEEFINEKCSIVTSLLEKLTEACHRKQFTKTLIFGKEIEKNLHLLENTKNSLKSHSDKRLFNAINKQISSCTSSYFYQKYESHKKETDRLVNSRTKNRELVSNILAANCEKKTRAKEVNLNALLERGILQCSSLLPLLKTNKQALISFHEIHTRIKSLLEYAKNHVISDEFVYYSSQILQTLDSLEAHTSKHNENKEILQDDEITKPISFLKTLTGVLESELFHIQEEHAAVLSKHIFEIKKLYELIKNLDPQLKLHISHDKTSLEPTAKKGKSKRFSGTSSNARQTMEFIFGKISEIIPNPKTNLLISEIVHMIDKNSWMKAILTNDSNRVLNVQFERIKQGLFKSFQVESGHGMHTQAEFWTMLLDIPSDSIFHRRFITSHHKFSHLLWSDQSKSPTEQLFLALNEKFAEATPYQRKQILQLALYWLQSPLQLGLRGSNLPNEIASVEIVKARPLIQSLIEQVKKHRCMALYESAQHLKEALKNCALPILIKADLTRAISPKQLLKSIATGTCKGLKYEETVTGLCKTLRTLCMYDFLNINHAELNKPPFEESAASIMALTKYSSFLSYWVQESIFRADDESQKKVDLKKQDLKEKTHMHSHQSIQRMIEFFIDVVVNLVDEKANCAKSPVDYHSAFAIYMILSKSYVQKLFTGPEPVFKISEGYLAKFQALATLFSSNETFHNLRKKYDEVPYHIPALIFICRDLTTSLDSELTPITHNEKINLTAVNKIGASTLAISQSQASLDYSNVCTFNLPHEFHRIEKTGDYCNHLNKFDDHIFDNIFYSIAQGLITPKLPSG